MTAASKEAIAYGRIIGRKLFTGRKGHGGKVESTYRQMREADLIALTAIAFDAGRAEADSELAAMLAKLRLIFAQRREFSDPERRVLEESLAVLNRHNIAKKESAK